MWKEARKAASAPLGELLLSANAGKLAKTGAELGKS
jgi:hypothetical protein